MEKIRIALAQINTVVGDISGNGEKIIDYIQKAEAMSADLVVFPELAVTGYPPEDLLLKDDFLAENMFEIKRIASNTGKISAAVGFVDCNESIFNAVGILKSGNLEGVYHKIYLPNYGVFDEKRYFSNGENCPVYIINGVRVGINICEDIWFENGPAKWQSQEGKAKVVVNISSSPFHMGKYSIREKMLSLRARENGVYVVYTNLVGGQDELVFDGGSLVIDPDGNVIVMGKQFEEELIVVDLSIDNRDEASLSDITVKINKSDSIVPVSGQAKKDKNINSCHEISILTLSNENAKKSDLLTKYENRTKMETLEEVYSALVLGLRDYVKKNGFKKGVLGLSGGIDSALTATIAVDALGRENVVCVTMPSHLSSKGSVTDSELLSRNLGIRMEHIPIASIIEIYHKCLGPFFQETTPGIAEENIQSRIRGNLIMALSNKFGWLPVATGNKSEFSTGYCTLYGDMAGGFALIKDVPKTLVYKLSAYRNQKEGYDLIPCSILEKEPSAELRPDQKDTDSLPEYSILDPILRDYVENDKKISRIAEKAGDTETVRRIIGIVDKNEYKRRQSPPGVKITPKAFGKDRRVPITNRFLGSLMNRDSNR